MFQPALLTNARKSSSSIKLPPFGFWPISIVSGAKYWICVSIMKSCNVDRELRSGVICSTVEAEVNLKRYNVKE